MSVCMLMCVYFFEDLFILRGESLHSQVGGGVEGEGEADFLAVLNNPHLSIRGAPKRMQRLLPSQDPESLPKIAKRKNQPPACPKQAGVQAWFLETKQDKQEGI